MRRAAFTTLLLVAACSSGTSAPGPGGEVVPDFLLRDVNPTSATHLDLLSPRQELGRLSAYYFGSAL